ncbi:snRNA-activating complex subunit 1, partial [Paramuricea clavata]
IRMTLSMWNDLMNLQENVKEQKHYDVYYVISSLRADKAFLFVATPIQLACGSRDTISQYEREVTKESKSSNTVKNAQEIIQKVNEIDDLYNSAKMKMCSPDEGEPLIDPVTLRVASNVLVSNLERDVKNFETWKKTSKDSLQVKHMQRIPQLGLPEDRKKDSEKQTEQVNESLTRAQVVKEIKDRSFKTVTQVSKGKRRHQPIPESPKSSDSERKLRKRAPKKKK